MPSYGIAQLEELAADLRAAGAVGLKRELAAGLRASAGPLKSAVHDAALEKLPKSGGLNTQVAGQRVSINTSLTARTVFVRLSTTAPDTAMTDRGFVRHPVFGRRGKGEWVTQQIPTAAGWWSQTLESKAPLVEASVNSAMARVEAKLMGGFGY